MEQKELTRKKSESLERQLRRIQTVPVCETELVAVPPADMYLDIIRSMCCQNCKRFPSLYKRFLCPDGHILCGDCGEERMVKHGAKCLVEIIEEASRSHLEDDAEQDADLAAPTSSATMYQRNLIMSGAQNSHFPLCQNKVKRYPADVFVNTFFMNSSWKCPLQNGSCGGKIFKGYDLFEHIAFCSEEQMPKEPAAHAHAKSESPAPRQEKSEGHERTLEKRNGLVEEENPEGPERTLEKRNGLVEEEKPEGPERTLEKRNGLVEEEKPEGPERTLEKRNGLVEEENPEGPERTLEKRNGLVEEEKPEGPERTLEKRNGLVEEEKPEGPERTLEKRNGLVEEEKPEGPERTLEKRNGLVEEEKPEGPLLTECEVDGCCEKFAIDDTIRHLLNSHKIYAMELSDVTTEGLLHVPISAVQGNQPYYALVHYNGEFFLFCMEPTLKNSVEMGFWIRQISSKENKEEYMAFKKHCVAWSKRADAFFGDGDCLTVPASFVLEQFVINFDHNGEISGEQVSNEKPVQKGYIPVKFTISIQNGVGLGQLYQEDTVEFQRTSSVDNDGDGPGEYHNQNGAVSGSYEIVDENENRCVANKGKDEDSDQNEEEVRG